MLAPLGLWIVLLGVQIAPIPAPMLEIVSPKAVAAYEDASLVGAQVIHAISIERNETAQNLLFSIALALLMVLVLLVSDSGERLKALSVALVASGSLQAATGIYLGFSEAHYTVFFREITHSATRISGSFVNPNSLAAYLEICLGCGIGLMVSQFKDGAVRTRKQWARWLFSFLMSPKFALRALLIVMVAGLILTRSRGGNAAFFSCTLIVGIVGLALLRSTSRAITVFFISMIVIDVFLVGSWVGVDRVAKRIEETTVSTEAKQRTGAEEESIEERRMPGHVTARAWQDYPLLGSGSGTFSYLYPTYRPPFPAGFYEHAHNDYAEFLLEGGFVGFALVATIYVSTMLACLWAVWRRRDQTRRGIALGCFFTLLCIAIHMNVDMPLQVPANSIVFCVVLAMAWLCALGRSRADGEAGAS